MNICNAKKRDAVKDMFDADSGRQSSGQARSLATKNMGELIEGFSRHFEIVSAQTDEQIKESWKLRYQVYSVENQFEKAADCPDQLERDEYDAHSAHCLLMHRASGLMVGTVRLVLPKPRELDTLFPIEKHCESSFNTTESGFRTATSFDRASLPRQSLAEISRFAISKEFKKRLHDQKHVWGPPDIQGNLEQEMDDLERRLIPHITIGLFAAIVRMSAEHGISHWYAVMEPALLRLLRQFSIRFQPIGPLMDYHGKRYPCVAVAEDVLAQMELGCPEVWRLITDNGRIWPSACAQAA